MLNDLLRLGRGFVRVRLTGYSPERFLNLCRGREILIWDLQNRNGAYEMCLWARDFRKLKPLIRKTHGRIRILERRGLPFFLHRNRSRGAFALGILLCSMILYVLSLFIWNIHLEGNHSISSEVLLTYLEEQEVCHGMPKSRVNCEGIRTGLRIRFPDIVWVSAEIRGTRLIIRMKENQDKYDPERKTQALQEEGDGYDIVADRDGVLVSILTRSGVPKAAAGDTVTAGQILISGDLLIMDDYETVLRHHYVEADGTIYARTQYAYNDSFPLCRERKVPTGRKRGGIFLELAGKRLLFAGIPEHFEYKSVRIDTWPLHLTENFYLPVSVGVKRVEEYALQIDFYEKVEAEALAEAHLEEFMQNLIEKGVQITENNVKIRTSRNECRAEGSIFVIEEIGRQAPLTPEMDLAEETERERNS